MRRRLVESLPKRVDQHCADLCKSSLVPKRIGCVDVVQVRLGRKVVAKDGRVAQALNGRVEIASIPVTKGKISFELNNVGHSYTHPIL